MCGRYASLLPAEAIVRIFGTVNPLPNLALSWNLAPSQPSLVVRRHPDTGERHLDVLHWGLLPHFTKDAAHARRPINARAETVVTSGLFRDDFARRRCLVPAAAFYEWKVIEGGKQPYAIVRRRRAAGSGRDLGELARTVRRDRAQLRDHHHAGPRRRMPSMVPLHDRMPLVLEPRDWPAWLGEVDADPTALLGTPRDGTQRAWPVSRSVNSPKNNGPELLEAISGS